MMTKKWSPPRRSWWPSSWWSSWWPSSSWSVLVKIGNKSSSCPENDHHLHHNDQKMITPTEIMMIIMMTIIITPGQKWQNIIILPRKWSSSWSWWPKNDHPHGDHDDRLAKDAFAKIPFFWSPHRRVSLFARLSFPTLPWSFSVTLFFSSLHITSYSSIFIDCVSHLPSRQNYIAATTQSHCHHTQNPPTL